jgi:hypothetical protein
LRGIELGRKNYLFLGSNAGGERAATLYSLLETAKLNGMNPESYLRDVLTVIADHPVNRVQELLPSRHAISTSRKQSPQLVGNMGQKVAHKKVCYFGA